MTFTEANTVEQMILDAVTGPAGGRPRRLRDESQRYAGDSLGDELRPTRWEYVPAAQLPRQPGEVMVEAWVR